MVFLNLAFVVLLSTVVVCPVRIAESHPCTEYPKAIFFRSFDMV